MSAADIAGVASWRMPGAPTQTARRYGISILGPGAVSGAHFLASLILLHAVPARAFGLFSFAMVVVALGMSVNVALISVPLTRGLATGDKTAMPACFQMNWLVCSGLAIALFALLLASGASLSDAALLALFAGIFTFRWFARNFSILEGRIATAIQSDLIYSLLLAGSLAALAVTRGISFTLGAQMLVVSALAGLLPFGPRFFRRQLAALGQHPRRYGPVFRDTSRWSLAGVITTELTANAHAYLVTLLAGPGAFATLALGMLLMRPAGLMQSALPDIERPVMARAIAARDSACLSGLQRHFTFTLLAAWTANSLLCAGLFLFVPTLVVKKDIGIATVIPVTAICALIMMIRAWRTPQAVLLQAAGALKSLAGISLLSAAISLAAAMGLLLAFGPIASLGGILLGEIVILARCWACARGLRETDDD